ncbi:MAG: rod shape-determining protein RodA [Pseudoduganella sp.]|jgi:rod shape determining protein RodA|nr:rod shape-determining protein RodA [Pseudoduganella sp.]
MRTSHHSAPATQLGAIFNIDKALLGLLLLLVLAGALTMYSAALDFPGRFGLHLRNILIALGIMLLVANIPPTTLLRFAPYLYATGVVLLVAVDAVGIIKKGSQRWLYVGFEFQPSELMKIATPLMLAWFFHNYSDVKKTRLFGTAALLLLVPVLFILKQPDLGTAILVFAAGFYIIFLAGLPWKVLFGLVGTTILALPFLWPMLHDYQRDRIMTLLHPEADPLGKGFQIRQAIIAIGSGGTTGKGWLEGTQGHLGFVPERSTDMVLSVFSEEFGLLGVTALLILFALLIVRGMQISARAATEFSRLMAAAMAMIVFTYVFVNIAMVSGMAPVVGIPLPFLTYGGTALATICTACGILASVQRESLGAGAAHR